MTESELKSRQKKWDLSDENIAWFRHCLLDSAVRFEREYPVSIKIDPRIPANEVHFMSVNGELLGKIINIGEDKP